MSHAYSIGTGMAMARAGAGFTQAQLASYVGVTPTAISMYENGKRDPSWSVLRRCAYACGYEVSEVVAMAERADDEPPQHPPSMKRNIHGPTTSSLPTLIVMMKRGRKIRHGGEGA